MECCEAGDLRISIVVPTLNEAETLRALVTRLDRALAGSRYEVIVVDDGSTDGTIEVGDELADEFPLRMMRRIKPADGLSGAVLYGMEQARGELLVVMDADLQHPPEQVPDLLAPLVRDEADFVLGSRYVAGGTTDRRWNLLRRANSRAATLLARPFAGPTRDPLSGFFALKRSTFQSGSGFNPTGYKIALELMCKCDVQRVREVPIRFFVRQAGESKLNLTQQARYLDHLSRLYDYCFPRASIWAKFAIATGVSWFVAFGFYVRLVAHNASPVLAPTIAFAAAAITTATFHYRFLRRHGKATQCRRDWIDFLLITLGEWSVCTMTARWVSAHVLPMSAFQFFGVVFGAVAVARYVLRMGLFRNLHGARPQTIAAPPDARGLRKAA